MSGPLGSQQWMYASGGFYDHTIDNSLRFNDDDSAYLSWTPASAGNRKTWTWSGWVKRGNLGVQQKIFSAASDGTHFSSFEFISGDNLQLYSYDGAQDAYLVTSQVFRDVGSWYHILVNFNTSDATSGNRISFYVNGQKVTAFSTEIYPSQNYEGYINNSVQHTICRASESATNYLDGYLADVNFIDGQALDPTSFGEFKSGIWIPKDTSGLTFGTNGFRLQFGDSAAIGDDTSGNTNDWTANNLIASDVVLDSPTDNFCTWNPLKSSGTLADGNLQVSSPNIGGSRSTIAVSSGKWYWEVTISTATIFIEIGVVPTTLSASADVSASGSNMSGYYASTGSKILNGSFTSYGSSFTTGDVIGVALNCDANTIEFYKNNVSQGSFTMATASGTEVQPVVADANSGASVTNTNFGQLGFTYTPPSDYLALSTANLPTGAIDTAADETPEDYFNTVLWSGNGSTQSISVGFQPDAVWIRRRNIATNHNIFDSIRGANVKLYPNLTNAEFTDTNALTSFDSDGFSLGADAEAGGASGSTYVGWSWKAGGTGVSNTDGSITSTVSVGATSQQNWFSIVSYTGTGSNATVGHGLNTEPQMIITKARANASSYWLTYHSGLASPSTSYMALNTTDAVDTGGASVWNSTAPTSSVFSVGTSTWINPNGGDMIAYCFANAEGLCKVGSYEANNSTDGPHIHLGFRPAFLIIKPSDTTVDWFIYDNKRDVDNVVREVLFANSSLAEASADSVDFLSNGFKVRNSGSGGINYSGTHIYLAISEQPFKYANAR